MRLWRKPARWDRQLEDAVAVTKAVEDVVLVLVLTIQLGAWKTGEHVVVVLVKWHPPRKKALLQWAGRESDQQVEPVVVVEVGARQRSPSTPMCMTSKMKTNALCQLRRPALVQHGAAVVEGVVGGWFATRIHPGKHHELALALGEHQQAGHVGGGLWQKKVPRAFAQQPASAPVLDEVRAEHVDDESW